MHLGNKINTEKRKRRAFISGFLICATNPKAAFFFGSILTAFVPENMSTEFLFSIVLWSGVLGVVLHSITATVFSTRAVVQKFQKTQRLISVGFGVIFTGFGLAVAYDTLTRTSAMD